MNPQADNRYGRLSVPMFWSHGRPLRIATLLIFSTSIAGYYFQNFFGTLQFGNDINNYYLGYSFIENTGTAYSNEIIQNYFGRPFEFLLNWYFYFASIIFGPLDFDSFRLFVVSPIYLVLIWAVCRFVSVNNIVRPDIVPIIYCIFFVLIPYGVVSQLVRQIFILTLLILIFSLPLRNVLRFLIGSALVIFGHQGSFLLPILLYLIVKKRTFEVALIILAFSILIELNIFYLLTSNPIFSPVVREFFSVGILSQALFLVCVWLFFFGAMRFFHIPIILLIFYISLFAPFGILRLIPGVTWFMIPLIVWVERKNFSSVRLNRSLMPFFVAFCFLVSVAKAIFGSGIIG